MKKSPTEATYYANGLINLSAIPSKEYDTFIKNLRHCIIQHLMAKKEENKPP